MKDINILQANILDIIFDGKNKEYGAYELRTNYQKRLGISVIGMIVACGVLFLLYSFAMRPGKDDGPGEIKDDITLVEVKDPEPEPPVEIEKPKPQPLIEMKQYTNPVITNEEVKPEDEVPEMKELEDVKIGTIDQDGEKDKGIIAPPIEGTKEGIIEAPKKDDEDWEKIFVSVQIESSYPGGLESWKRFLNKTLRYPEDAVENQIKGIVVVQFIVDKEGNVSNVEAISGPDKGGLREEAVRVIKKSGKWTPANQNGREVKSYKKQPIVFVLEE